MYLKEFYIDNFRGFRKFRIKSNENINILTGINNSGKTTILEAISLWNEIFTHLISQAKKSDNLIGIKSGDYRFGIKNQNYLDYREINSVRSFGYKDVFYKLNNKATIKLSALIQISSTEQIEIGFIMKEANGNNYNVHLDKHDTFNFITFNTSFKNLPKCINCYFSSPVATISSFEEFATEPKIKEGIKIRESFLYFRNRLFNLSKENSFENFKTDLSNILYNESDLIDFKFKSGKEKDIYIYIDIDIKKTGFKNLSLLGSGSIQIIEILLHLYESRKELNLILLDEPDSHIHRDIQKRLLNYLKKSTVQVFLTTHNESLLRSAHPNNIFFIDDKVSNSSITTIVPIGKDKLPQRKIGIASSHHSKIISEMGSETSLDILNALEANKIIFVEGTDDSEYIQKLIEIGRCDKDCVFWSFGGLDNLISKIKHYKEFFQSLGSNQSIWDKCSIIIDADFLTDKQKENLCNELKNKLGIPVFIWESYTIEATLLNDLEIIEQLINKVCEAQAIVNTADEVKETILLAINNIKDDKINSLNNIEEFGRRVTGQLDARVINLANNLDISRSKVFGKTNQSNLYNEFRIFATQQLNTGRIAHISSKEDVELIFEQIFSILGLTKDLSFINYFASILDLVDSSTINQEWQDLINFVND